MESKSWNWFALLTFDNGNSRFTNTKYNRVQKKQSKKTTRNTPTRNGSSNQTNLFLFAKMNLFTFWKRKAHSFDDDDYYLFIFFNKFKSTKFQVFSWWKVSLICLTKHLWYCCSQIKTKHRIPYVCCISVCECFFRLYFFFTSVPLY